MKLLSILVALVGNTSAAKINSLKSDVGDTNIDPVVWKVVSENVPKKGDPCPELNPEGDMSPECKRRIDKWEKRDREKNGPLLTYPKDWNITITNHPNNVNNY